MWINEHGEVVSETLEDMPEGCGWIEPEDVPAEPDQSGDDWVPNWLAKQFLHADAELAAAREQHRLIESSIKARRRWLEWSYLRRAEVAVAIDMEAEGSKKKSRRYSFGTLGWRTSKRVTVTDEGAALEWAAEHCEAAVKVSRSLLKSRLPKGEDVPGVERETVETFYVRPAVPK